MGSDPQPAAATIRALLDGLSSVIQGKNESLRLLVSTLLAGGHALIEDAPGLGKTTVARTLAALIGSARFRRIQFTPDLLPYDITGVDVFDPKTTEFVFRPGPVFADVVLADEINRSTPKVQSALLEVMAERQRRTSSARSSSSSGRRTRSRSRERTRSRSRRSTGS